MLELSLDDFGFFQEMNNRLDVVKSRVKGIYIAGMCQSPMDIQRAVSQGMSVAGYVLSSLIPGKKLEVEPVIAVIDKDRCSGCKICVAICPYKAIIFDDEKDSSIVQDVLCQGCGTCVSACPAGAIKGNHFTNEQILAEVNSLVCGHL
jgi:heterodisulfide reductase subunit A